MSRKKRGALKSLSSAELKKAEDGLYYIIWMLNETANVIDISKSVKNNAYIESFVIHARTLIVFLYGKPDGKDTILASNFIDGWNKSLNKTDFLCNIKDKANKMAAHLTEGGLNWPDKEWDISRIRYEINIELSEFLKAVPDDRITSGTKSKVKRRRRTRAASCGVFILK